MNPADAGLERCRTSGLQLRFETGILGLPAPECSLADAAPCCRFRERSLRQQRENGLFAHSCGLLAVTLADDLTAFCGLLRTFCRHSSGPSSQTLDRVVLAPFCAVSRTSSRRPGPQPVRR